MPWWSYAFLSAGAAAFTAVLAKLGVTGVPSHLATAVCAVVVGVLPADRCGVAYLTTVTRHPALTESFFAASLCDAQLRRGSLGEAR